MNFRPCTRPGAARTVLAVLFVLSLLAGSADACPVCFSSDDGPRKAFLYTTIVMSALPMALVGGLTFWIFRRSKGGGADAG